MTFPNALLLFIFCWIGLGFTAMLLTLHILGVPLRKAAHPPQFAKVVAVIVYLLLGPVAFFFGGTGRYAVLYVWIQVKQQWILKIR